MEGKEDFLTAFTALTQRLSSRELTGPSSLFTLTLQQMAKDSNRWVENGWVTPSGNTPPIEQVIQVLAQDLIVLLNHGAEERIQDDLLEELLQLTGQAAQNGVLEDSTQRTIFIQLLDTEA